MQPVVVVLYISAVAAMPEVGAVEAPTANVTKRRISYITLSDVSVSRRRCDDISSYCMMYVRLQSESQKKIYFHVQQPQSSGPANTSVRMLIVDELKENLPHTILPEVLGNLNILRICTALYGCLIILVFSLNIFNRQNFKTYTKITKIYPVKIYMDE